MIKNIAQMIYLLKGALTAYRDDQSQDAILRIEFDLKDQDNAEKIEKMYRSWAKLRGMNMKKVQDEADGAEGSKLFTVAGFGAYLILNTESGYHVLEEADPKKKSTSKEKIKLTVLPLELADLRSGDVKRMIQRCEDTHGHKTIWRYRKGPSALVKDLKKEWQTGKVDRVLKGDFDLL